MMESGLVLDIRETYLARIRNSVGSSVYKNCWFRKPDGKLVDVCQNGRFYCAVFVSNILSGLPLLIGSFARVEKLVQAMLNHGWIENIDWLKPSGYIRSGSIIVWEPCFASDKEKHYHIGFFLEGTECVSTDPRGVSVIKHHIEFVDYLEKSGRRKVEKVYEHPLLQERI